jgi:hypothetical protein
MSWRNLFADLLGDVQGATSSIGFIIFTVARLRFPA